MKQNYLRIMFALACLFSAVFAASAQTSGSAKEIKLGYVDQNAYLYEFDGISLDHKDTVSVAIKLTKAMLAPYVGGTIVGIYAGWDTPNETGKYTGWVRRTFNGPNLTQSKLTTVRAKKGAYYNLEGWNTLKVTPLVITDDMDELVVGFTTELKKDLCAIPLLYPSGTPNSDWRAVHSDRDADGNLMWYDFSSDRCLAIMLIISDTENSFSNTAKLTNVMQNGIVLADKPASSIICVKNGGASAIKDFEVTTTFGTKTYSETVNISQSSLAAGGTKFAAAPVYCFGTGTHDVSITKVNGEPNSDKTALKVNLIGVPEEVSDKYTHRPLLEYFTSENSYWGGYYYDNIVGPGIENYTDLMTLVCQHLDDQFMTGDDDATRMALDFWNEDSMRVSIPAIALDRSLSFDHVEWQRTVPRSPLSNCMYEPFSAYFYDGALGVPTFASVEGKAMFSEKKDSVSIWVEGDVEPGIMPEGEPLYLTIYFMEKDVDTDSQTFRNEEDEAIAQGKYTHPNVIRQVLSGMYGDEISMVGSKYQKYVKFDLDPDWNTENCYVVAFLNRGVANDNFNRQVINCTEFQISDYAVGINDVLNAKRNAAGRVYSVSGVDVTGSSKLPAGVYIQNGKKFLVK